MKTKKSDFLTVSNRLREIGISLTYSVAMQEYRTNFAKGGELTACYDDTLENALQTGLSLGKEIEREELLETVSDTFSAKDMFQHILHDSKLTQEELIQKNLDRMAKLKEAIKGKI